jgi:hypothetical protein
MNLHNLIIVTEDVRLTLEYLQNQYPGYNMRVNSVGNIDYTDPHYHDRVTTIDREGMRYWLQDAQSWVQRGRPERRT